MKATAAWPQLLRAIGQHGKSILRWWIPITSGCCLRRLRGLRVSLRKWNKIHKLLSDQEEKEAQAEQMTRLEQLNQLLKEEAREQEHPRPGIVVEKGPHSDPP